MAMVEGQVIPAVGRAPRLIDLHMQRTQVRDLKISNRGIVNQVVGLRQTQVAAGINARRS